MTGSAPISIFLPNADGGGAERNMLRLARAFHDRGTSVQVVFATARGPLLTELAPGMPWVDLGCRRVMTSPPKLASYLRRVRPRALVSALDHANVAALLAGRLEGDRTPVVASVRNTMSHQLGRARTSRERFWLPRFMRWLYPQAAAVVAVSTDVADDLQAVIGGSVPVDVIGNPVVDDALLARGREPVADPWFVPESPPVIVAIGRLTEQKGFDVLLRALALLRTSPATRLWVAGQGELEAELRRLALALGVSERVRWAGFTPNPFPYLARCRVFVSSSRYEGLPTAVIEALALGARVVATDCPGGPREVLGRGRWGRLVPVDDERALASALGDALEDGTWELPPPEMLARYSPAAILSQWDAVLDRVA